jgi:hypothetical protein
MQFKAVEPAAELLATDDIELITTIKKNMKPRVMAAFDALLLRKRSIIETINDHLTLCRMDFIAILT